MVNILYFAWMKERMDRAEETLALPQGVTTIATLSAHLRARDPNGARAFAEPALIRAAVNQDFATPDTPIKDGDEIAFFPPVTGG